MFFYPSQDRTWLLESDDSGKAQLSDLDKFQSTVCKLLFVIHQRREPTEAEAQLVKDYCMECTSDLIFKSKNLYFILGDADEPSQDKSANIQKQEGQILSN